MGETCEVCGREKIVRGQGFQEDRCWRGFLEQDDMKCYRLGYERSQAALAAANEELAKYRARPYATLAADLRAAEADLRAARRECEAVRKALSDLIQEMNFGGGCDGNDPSCDGCVAVEAARAALAAPADGDSK